MARRSTIYGLVKFLSILYGRRAGTHVLLQLQNVGANKGFSQEIQEFLHDASKNVYIFQAKRQHVRAVAEVEFSPPVNVFKTYIHIVINNVPLGIVAGLGESKIG